MVLFAKNMLIVSAVFMGAAVLVAPDAQAKTKKKTDKSAGISLTIEKVLLITQGKRTIDPDSFDLVRYYCNARKTPALKTLRVVHSVKNVPAKTSFRYVVTGSSSLFVDEEGYYECDEEKVKVLARGTFKLKGKHVNITFRKPLKKWPCSYKIRLVAMDKARRVISVAESQHGIACPE